MSDFELPSSEKKCHHTGFEKSCRGLVCSGTCERWKHLPGADPFTGHPRQAWGCIDDLVLFLQGEALRQTDGANAATTQLREMLLNAEYRRTEAIAHREKLIEATPCK